MTLSSRLKRRFKFIGENISIHGVKFLVSDAHIAYKVIWCCTLFWFFFIMQDMIVSTLKHSKADSVAVNIDTSYARWENNFPSIAICFRKDRSCEGLFSFLDEYFGDNPPPQKRSFYRFAQTYAFIAPARTVNEISLDVCLAYNATCGLNLDVIQAKAMPTTCSDFILSTKYLGEERKCEELLTLERTEMGICYTTRAVKKPLKFSRKSPFPIQLEFEYKASDGYGMDLFIFSPGESVTSYDTPFALPKVGSYLFVGLLLTETKSQKEVQAVDPSIRRCKFTFEKTPVYNFPYSVANCHMELRIQEEMKACNCTAPVNRYPHLKYCDIHGLNCLKTIKRKGVPKNSDDPVVDDSGCVALCTEMQITVTGNYMRESRELAGKGKVIIEITNLPNMRYIRTLMTKDLDIIVICSSIVGLFTGASILSLLEIFYLIIFRKYTNM
ncbi:uncharacterized protein LOC134837064 [Culicoides brevitarsis]|uniref:uncharacterized protein LOC134837064 n=1 Tax=Culicoides brevitarsis TaxID=469753 RepID=UPI00307BDB46